MTPPTLPPYRYLLLSLQNSPVSHLSVDKTTQVIHGYHNLLHTTQYRSVAKIWLKNWSTIIVVPPSPHTHTACLSLACPLVLWRECGNTPTGGSGSIHCPPSRMSGQGSCRSEQYGEEHYKVIGQCVHEYVSCSMLVYWSKDPSCWISNDSPRHCY